MWGINTKSKANTNKTRRIKTKPSQSFALWRVKNEPGTVFLFRGFL
jgi:hypothetical protein